MSVLILSGVTSFTGYWFAVHAVENGLRVIGTTTRKLNEYSGIEEERLKSLSKKGVEIVDNAKFGSRNYSELIGSFPSSTVALHGAPTAAKKETNFTEQVTEIYKSASNVFDQIKNVNSSVVITESIYQYLTNSISGEYGMGKKILSQVYIGFAEKNGISYSKFVIGNPFGPFQSGRLASYIRDCLVKNEEPVLKRPDDIQNNLLIYPLAREYLNVVTCSPEKRPLSLCPIQYIESNNNFTKRLQQYYCEFKKTGKIIGNNEENTNIYIPTMDLSQKYIKSNNIDWEKYFKSDYE